LDDSIARNPRKNRRLQLGNQCFYGAQSVADSAPTEREFLDALNEVLSGSPVELSGKKMSALLISEEVNNPEPSIDNRQECTNNKDCLLKFKGDFCINNQCIRNGNPRITLTWYGDDDLDLSVTTPDGERVGYENLFDQSTGGSFDTLYSQFNLAYHVESISFPMSGAPSGEYRIEVDAYEVREDPDIWTLEVYTSVDGVPPFPPEVGQGSRDDIILKFGDKLSAASFICSMKNLGTECCKDKDCQNSGSNDKICRNRKCIIDILRTFTLTWIGGESISLVCDKAVSLLHNSF
jgi:hypothetical protein